MVSKLPLQLIYIWQSPCNLLALFIFNIILYFQYGIFLHWLIIQPSNHWEYSDMDITKNVGLRESASTTTFIFPFLYSLSKSYDYTFLTHLCCMSFKPFWVRKCLRLLWSIFTMNLPPTKYCWNLANACIMANISLSYIEYSPHEAAILFSQM